MFKNRIIGFIYLFKLGFVIFSVFNDCVVGKVRGKGRSKWKENKSGKIGKVRVIIYMGGKVVDLYGCWLYNIDVLFSCFEWFCSYLFFLKDR